MKRVKITSENINDLYGKINELIDSYFEWKVKPSALKRYLKKGSVGLKKFIERNDLGNIEKIDKIILDVVEDRFGMEDDGVLTFESFNSTFVEQTTSHNEGHDKILYSGIEDSDIEYEKIIADKYRTSLGHVELSDESKHIYEVSDRLLADTVIVFSDNDLGIIEGNLISFIYNHLSKSSIKMKTIGLDIKISDVLGSEEDLEKKLHLEAEVIDVVSEILQNDEYVYDGVFKGYHFWKK